ncbi:LOW QUALITY PROTEIN: centromere-associated protein E-like [Lethenteron reissneri]|uniref:LOW QUALITY PROTEIN: centromere-associated protein E-like n=1 Tax=Lethenteron reissneri TaxID=7753 RepID=UPI002AB6D43B|nr:LOW QUALITY PROTEIN: centromere-associated protein E-like [Lethenteron reissneri]
MGEDNVKVCVRIRPLIQRETSGSSVTYWKSDKHSMSQIDNNKSFIFDRVFGLDEQTYDVFDEIARPIIKAAVKGYNGTIFAYGQTSSGKTFTMMGSESYPGIIPLAMKEVFDVIKNLPGREFLLRVSYMEIYNETICDLLSKDKKKKSLEIHEDANRTVYVADLSEEVITSIKDILEIMRIGEKNRHYGETKMNDHSSRSHTIFRMIIESRERSQRESMDGVIAVSHLNLVDLAGSERTRQTGAEGLRLKEGCNINRSLFILGQVIKKLSENPSGSVYLNYRDSKLTRILQNSLGGNAKTVILCTVTPAALEETLSTLMFASTAKNMKNSAHVNEVINDEAMLKCCRREIMNLKKELMQKTQMHQAQAQQLAERDQLQRESEERIRSLKHMIINYSVTAAGAADDSAFARPKRRETWCPGLLRSHAKKFRGNSNMTGDLDLTSATDATQGEDTPDSSLLDVNKSLGSVSVRRKRGSSAMVMVRDDPEEEESEWLRSVSSEDSPLFSKLQAKVSELEEELQDARLKEAEKNGQFMAILDDRDELRQELATLKAKLKEMEAERQRVETGAHDSPLETAGAPSDHLVASNGASGQHFNSTKDENDPNAAPLALQLNVQDYEEQISALKGRVAACEKENSRLRDAAMEAENIAQYLEEISNLQSGLSHLKTENSKLRALMENRSPEGKEALDSSCEAPKDSPANALLAEENACLKLEWETMGKEVEKVQAECAEASSRLLDCQFRLSAMEVQNSELNDELHTKNRGLDEANTSLKSLQEELSSLRMKLRENEDGNAQHDEDGAPAVQLLEERLTGFKDQVTEMKIINQDLATELALKELNLQKAEQSAKVSAEEISTLQLSSDAAKAELERLKSLLEQKSEELDQWASSSMDEKMQLELQLASLRKEMEQLGEELQIARESKEQAGDSYPEMEASDAVARLSSLETKCEMLQSKLGEKSNELDTLAGVLEENRSLQTKLESENQGLQDKVVKMSLEYEREICNNKTLVTEIDVLQQQAREFDDDNSRLVEESKGYSETITTLQHSVEEAQQQVSLLKDSVEKLTEENYELKMDTQGTTLMSRPAQEPVSQGSRKRAEGRRSTRRSSRLIANMELSFDECDYRLLNPQQAADTCSIIPENLAEVELESLRGKLASLEEENKSLLALLPPAPEKLKEEMSDSMAELLARVPILEEEKCRLEVALDAKTRELGSISDEAITIQQQLKSAEKEIENLQMILDALNEESVNQYKLSSSESNRMNTMEEENESLRKKLEALLAHAAESDHVEVSNEADVNLEDKLRTLDVEKANLQAQIEHVQAECQALTNAADDNAGRMRVVESELESARLRNEEMSITLLSVQAKLQEVDHENAQLRDHVNSANELDDKLSTAMETILVLNEKLSSIQIEKQELQVRVDSLQTQSDELSTASNITALNSELQLLLEEKEALQSQFEDAVLRCERLSSISDELADLKVRFAMTEDEKESLQLQIDSLAKEKGDRYLKGAQEASMLEEKMNVLEHEKRVLQILLDSDRKRGEDLSAETEMISLKVKLQELQDQNEVLRSQMEFSDVQCQHLSGRSNEVADLKSRLHTFVEENVMVQSCENSDGVKRDQLSASSDEVVFLKVKLQELQGEREQMQSQLYSLQLQCEQLSSAPDEIRDLKTRLGVLEEEKELLQTQLNSTHSQELSDELAKTAEEMSALKERLELVEGEKADLQVQLDSAKTQQEQWSSATDELATLKLKLQALQDEKEQLELQFESLGLQCKQLSAASEIADLTTKLQVIEIENADLKTRLRVLEEEKELLQTQLNSSTHSQELADKSSETADKMSALTEKLQLVELERSELQLQLDSAKAQQDEWAHEMSTLKHNFQELQDEKKRLESWSDSLRLQCEQLSATSDELADLKTKLQVIQIENSDLKTRLHMLVEAKEELLQTHLNSSKHSQELGNELAKTAEEISALKERLELVEGEKADLQVQLDSAKTQQEQWSSATDELATLKLKLQALQDEKEQLELQLESLGLQCEQLSAASEIADLTTKLQVIEIENADLKTRLRVLEEEKELFQTQLNSSTHSQELGDELVKTAEEISALKERLELVEGEKADLQVQLDSAKTQQDQWSSATDELATLKLQLQALQDEKEQIELQFDLLRRQCEQLSAASDELADLKTKLQVIEIEDADLKTRVRVLEEERELLQIQLNSSTHSQELGDELVKTAEEISALKEKLELVEGEKADLQVQLDSAKTQQDQWSSATDELATLKLQLQALQDEKEQIELQFDLLRRQCEQLSAASDELADLKTKLQVIEIEDADLKTRVRVLEEERELLQIQLNSSTHSQELGDELAKTAEEISALKERLELVEGEKADLQLQLDSAKTQQDQWSSATDELATLKLQLQALQDEKEQIELQFDLLRRQCEQLSAASDELADLKIKLQVIQNENLQQEHSRNKEMSAMKDRNLELQALIDSLQTQKDLLSITSDEIVSLKAALEALQTEREELKSQLDFANSQCEQLSFASEETSSLRSKLEMAVVESARLQSCLESANTQLEVQSHVTLELEQMRSALSTLEGKRARMQALLGCGDTTDDAREEEEDPFVGKSLPSAEAGRVYSRDSMRDSGIERSSGDMVELGSNIPLLEDEQLLVCDEGDVGSHDASVVSSRMEERDAERDELRRSLEELKGEFVQVQNERRRSSHKHLNQEQHLENQLLESIQLCESLLLEKKELEAQLEERVNFVEKLQEDLRTKKVELQDLQELQEFENLEKKTEHEAQLMHEFEQLKKLVQKGEEYNQELEADLKRTLQELRCKEEEMLRLQEEMLQMTEAMSKQQRWENDMPKGSDAQELREHVKTLRKSLEDAEIVTKDSTKQAAILRTENLGLKEQMADIQVRLQALTREAEGCRSSLEQEKMRYRSMEMDLQRELHSIYADHTRLSQLLDGKVPKDLQTRYELEKQLQEVKARLQSMMERDQMQTEASHPDKADNTARELAALMQETSELKEKLSLATAERDQLAAKLEMAAREKVDLQRRALARDDEELALEKENVATEKELALQQELCLAEELACKKAELSQSYLASSVEHRDATGALSAVTEQLSDMEERVRCLTLQRDELSARVDTLVAERESLLTEKGLLESALLSQEAGAREEHRPALAGGGSVEAIQIQAELLELQAKLKASQMKQKDMEKALQEKSTEVVRMQKRLMEAQSSAQAMQIQGELFELQEKMKASEMQQKDMEKALHEKSTEVVCLQKQLTEAQVSEQRRTLDEEQRHSALVEELRAAHHSSESLRDEVQVLSRQVVELEQQLALAQEKNNNFIAEAAQHVEEQRHSAVVEELRAAHQSSEGLRDEVQVLSRQVAELEQQLELAQEKNNNFIAEAAHHVEELNLMTSQSEYFMKLIDESDMELKEEKNRTKELLARVASLESQLQAATAGGIAGPSGLGELQQLKEKLMEVEASLKFNKETMSSSEKAFGETVERLQSELAVEKRQADVLRQRVAVLESEAPHLGSQLQVARAEQSADTSESQQQQLETLRKRSRSYRGCSSAKMMTEMKFQSECFMKLIDDSDMELQEERKQTKELLARVASLESQLQAATSGGRAGPSDSGELQQLKEKLTEVEASLKFNKETMGSNEKAFGETVERLQSELAVEKRQTDVLRQRVAVLESEAPHLGSQSADTSESPQQLKTLKEEVRKLQELLASGNDGKEEAVALRAKVAEMVSRESELEQRVIRRDSQLCDLKRRLQILMKPNKPDADGKESADVKYELVKLQLEKYKLESIHEKEVKSLKTTLSAKEQILRRLKEDLRAARQQADSTFSEPSHSASSGVVTCGGGSGVIQATALIILQNENTRLNNELKHLKLKLTSIKEGTMLVRLKDSATKYKRESEALRQNVKLLQSQLDLQKVESIAAASPSPQLPPAPKTASDAPVGSLRTPTKRAKACIENKAPLSPRKNLMMPQPKKHYFEPGAPIALPSNVQFFDNSRLELSPHKRAPRSTADRDDEDFWKEPSHADQCKQQ